MFVRTATRAVCALLCVLVHCYARYETFTVGDNQNRKGKKMKKVYITYHGVPIRCKKMKKVKEVKEVNKMKKMKRVKRVKRVYLTCPGIPAHMKMMRKNLQMRR